MDSSDNKSGDTKHPFIRVGLLFAKFTAAALPILGALKFAVARYRLPEKVLDFAFGAIIFGFILILLLDWARARRSGRRPKRSTQAAYLGLALAAMAILIFVILWKPTVSAPESGGKTTGGASAGDAAAAAAGKSLAVLPFGDTGGWGTDVSIREGLAEELGFRLGETTGIKTAAWSRALDYRKTEKSKVQICKELGVNALLTGKIKLGGGQASFEGTLTSRDVQTKKWEEKSLAWRDDLVSISGRLALLVAEELDLNPTPAQTARLGQPLTSSEEALTSYFKGREAAARDGKKDTLKAMEAYQAALGADPSFAAAQAALAETYFRGYTRGYLAESYGQEAVDLVGKAIEMDPESPASYKLLASILLDYRKKIVENIWLRNAANRSLGVRIYCLRAISIFRFIRLFRIP